MDLLEAANFARQKLNEFQLYNWIFEFDRAARRFGCCNYTKKKITLSKALTELNSFEQVRDTILHEIAHALTPGSSHGYRWKRTAMDIGCSATRCYDHTKVVRPEPLWIATCDKCNITMRRNKLPRWMKARGMVTTHLADGGTIRWRRTR